MSFAVTRSKHPASELHASARVLSGGSIYVSDYPGQHDFDVRSASTSALLFCKMLVCLTCCCASCRHFAGCVAGPGSWCCRCLFRLWSFEHPVPSPSRTTYERQAANAELGLRRC